MVKYAEDNNYPAFVTKHDFIESKCWFKNGSIEDIKSNDSWDTYVVGGGGATGGA